MTDTMPQNHGASQKFSSLMRRRRATLNAAQKMAGRKQELEDLYRMKMENRELSIGQIAERAQAMEKTI